MACVKREVNKSCSQRVVNARQGRAGRNSLLPAIFLTKICIVSSCSCGAVADVMDDADEADETELDLLGRIFADLQW